MMDKPLENVQLIRGGSHSDPRGVLKYCNDFDMINVRRFYTIRNSKESPVRGWIGHRHETKWFLPIRGRTIVEVEKMDNLQSLQSSLRQAFTLDASEPSVLKVGAGNWFAIRQSDDAELMVFSDVSFKGMQDDDLRRPL